MCVCDSDEKAQAKAGKLSHSFSTYFILQANFFFFKQNAIHEKPVKSNFVLSPTGHNFSSSVVRHLIHISFSVYVNLRRLQTRKKVGLRLWKSGFS